MSDWVEKQLEQFPGSDRDVLTFIDNVANHCGVDSVPVIENLFACGYCYYFALMLKDAFGRGTICNTGRGHIVWLDGTDRYNDIAYDIHGVDADYEVLIPVSAMGQMLYDFKRVPGLTHGSTKEEIDRLVEYWKNVPRIGG